MKKTNALWGQHLPPDWLRHCHSVSAARHLGDGGPDHRLFRLGPVAHFHPAHSVLEVEPYLPSARRQSRKQREGLENFDISVGPVLLRHVNHRISEHLQSSYPKAHWEWTMADPARFVVYGGTGRIRVFGVPDYDYADVTLDQQGNLRCALIKIAPLEETPASGQHPLDPRAWYELQGRSVLENLIAGLRSRGTQQPDVEGG